jgi:transcriptional regulator GlxA family with amidase domain
VSEQQVAGQREVVLVAFDGLQTLDLAGPLEVFAGANQFERSAGRPTPYRLSIAGVQPGLVRTWSGLGLLAESGLPSHQVDTIVVPGGDGAQQARYDEQLLAWLRSAARAGTGARRVCSVCTGAFILAEAGLLDGRQATTHWSRAGQLAREYPQVRVDSSPLFVRDGRVWTSAGVTAGIDLALALVEADLGSLAAQTIARWLVLFLRRSGGQSQFAAEVWTDPPQRDVLAKVMRSVHAEPGGDHRLAALAERAGMSERHLQRCFREEFGTTPTAFVTRVRVDAARRLLEQESATVEVTARRCGFGTAETMRRAFQAQLGVPPDTYRDRFTTTRQTATRQTATS